MITLKYKAKKLHCEEHVRKPDFDHFDSDLNNTLRWKDPIEEVTMWYVSWKLFQTWNYYLGSQKHIGDKDRAAMDT